MDLASMVWVVGLYVAVAATLFGFVAAVYGSTMRTKVPRTSAEWGLPGIGKVYPLRGSRHEVIGKVTWSYKSAYDKQQTVFFDDPADAYEYVVKALRSWERMIERLENATWKGLPTTYEWLWIDSHTEREFWLSELREFKEDV